MALCDWANLRANWPKDVIGIEHSAQFNILLDLHLCCRTPKRRTDTGGRSVMDEGDEP